ncbi:MAG: hypothetical protein ABSA12_10480 [Verrucomicrobiia bacterium]|jgi:hypothetical protein
MEQVCYELCRSYEASTQRAEGLAIVHLKQARAKGKLAEFVREREKTHPHTHKHRFRAVVKSMALGKARGKKKG